MSKLWLFGTLHTDGWGGRQRQRVIVVDETPKRYRVRPVPGTELRLPRRAGVLIILGAGTALVPKYAVVLDAAFEHSQHGTVAGRDK